MLSQNEGLIHPCFRRRHYPHYYLSGRPDKGLLLCVKIIARIGLNTA
jgi:hypothetical protein